MNEIEDPTSDLLEQYTSAYELEPDLTTYRVEMQRDAYEILRELLDNAKLSTVAGRHLIRSLLATTPYSNASDVSRALTALAKVQAAGFDNLLKFLGSPDTPAQIAMATSQRKESARSTQFQAMDPLERERFRMTMTSVYGDFMEAEIVTPPTLIPITTEPDDNLRLFPEIFLDPE
jgi:hypothetical protein